MSKERRHGKNNKVFELNMGHAGVYKPWVAHREKVSPDRNK